MYILWVYKYECVAALLGVGEGDAIKLLGPVWTTKVSFSLQASNGIRLISLPQHDGKCLVVLPATSKVNVSVQEITGEQEGRG